MRNTAIFRGNDHLIFFGYFSSFELKKQIKLSCFASTISLYVERAASKRTRSPKRRKPDPFAVVRGKVVERIEVSTMQGDCAIGILFEERTYLGFDLDPFLRITPDYSDWKTHNYKPLKRWPPLRSE